jgi:hypothetical protein
MKKLLLFSMFCMLSMMSYAESVTFSWEGASTDTGKSDGWEATQNGVTLAFWKNAGSNVPATNKEGSVRLYNGSKLIISAPSGCNITSVAFTPTSNTYSATNLKYNGTALTSDTWTLDDPVSSVELVAAANARFKQIVVTYMSASSDKLSAPVFSPTAGSYYGAQTITLSGSANATIYYSLDGENYNVYTEPFQIKETSTVYAYSKVEEKTSDIVTAVYTIIPIVTYNSITDLAAACTATSANDAPVVKLSARLVVTYVNGQNTFVSDGERGFLIYGTNTQYTTVGTVLSGSIEGKLYAYKNLKELAITDGWANVTPGAEFSGVTPGDATISALLGNADGYESSLVKINKVNFEANALTSRSVTVMDEEGDELTLYDKFNVLSATSFNTSDQYNITGFLARNGENVEFGVTAIEAVPKNVAAPTFNIETGTYEVDQTVTLTAEEGTTIYYTIDGTTPTAKSNVYTTPIIVRETTTINAIAVDAKGNTSTIASVTITIDKPYTTIAELNTACTATKKADAPTVKFKFTDLLVTGVKNSNVYVSDGEKGFLIYGNGYSFKKGDKISGTITGLLYSYSGLNELAVSDDYANVTITSSGNAVTATEKNIQTINADYKALESQYVTILNVTFGATAVSSKNVSISDGTGSLTLRDNFNILSSETFDTSATYTVKAFVLNYNGTAQVYPIAVEDIVKNVPDAINGVKVAIEEGSIYTLQGQKVERITNKGIYIINGKKVLVK